MPTPTSTRWIDTLAQRVDRIRRAYNLCELQRSTYMLVAAALAGATLLLVTALFGSTRLFAAIAWSTLTAFVVTTVLLVRETNRRWLRPERAVAWIENRTALGGRLRSLIELHARGEHTGVHFFLPLLRNENERALPSWEPRDVVPRRIPWVALGIALVTTFTLFAVLTLTPVLHPRVPELAATAASSDAETHASARADLNADIDEDMDDDNARRSQLATIPAEIQERIRQSVWGRAWERVREAMLEEQRSRQRAASRAPHDEPGPDGDTERPWQLADRTRPGTQPRSRGRNEADPAPAQERAPRRALEQRNSPMDREGRSGAGTGAGAGSSTNPELYGAAAPPDLASHARFELGLVTRMRLQHRRGQPGEGNPPRSPDQRPLLTVSNRGEELAHEMAIPRAYEPIVRQVFAHRGVEGLE